jgi:predicted dithiol-disulfide oxidoreductase (DUF899 family)
MFGSGDAGCSHCSFWADNFDGAVVHLANRDATMVCISRAPFESLKAFKERMGWNFVWFSSGGSDFNYDFNASFTNNDIASGKAFWNFNVSASQSSE